MRSYVYLVRTSQVQGRSSIMNNSAFVMGPQRVFKITFNPLVNEDYSINVDIGRYQSILEHVKVEFSIGTGIYMLPSNSHLSTRKTTGYSSKILISSSYTKTT